MTLIAASEAFLTKAQVRANPDCGCVNADEPADAILDAIIEASSDAIAIATGFDAAGHLALVARPCRTGCDDCDYTCTCCGLDGIPLGYNVTVTQVKIDGDVVPADHYEVHPSRLGAMLVRINTPTGHQPGHWPSSQRRWLADTEDHTFAIYFTQGLNAEDSWLIEQAAMEVVCDWISTVPGRDPNALPEGVTGATMGQVTVSISEDRMMRIRTGDVGPATRRLVGLIGGAQRSAVWAPELEGGWQLNVRLAA